MPVQLVIPVTHLLNYYYNMSPIKKPKMKQSWNILRPLLDMHEVIHVICPLKTQNSLINSAPDYYLSCVYPNPIDKDVIMNVVCQLLIIRGSERMAKKFPFDFRHIQRKSCLVFNLPNFPNIPNMITLDLT